MISVIVPTFDRRDDLERCLKSLLNQNYRNFEIIVIEGGSTEETRRLLSKYNCDIPIKLIAQTKKGLANARNQAWSMATGRFVSFIDDDAVASKKWLEELIKTFKLDARIGGVTGPTIIPKEHMKYRDLFKLQAKLLDEQSILLNLLGKIYFDVVLEGKPFEVGQIFRSGAFSIGSNYKESMNLPRIVEVDYLEACNMSFRKEVIESVGGFDNGYVGTAEWNEPDICFRIKKKGYVLLFNPRVRIEHLVSRAGVYMSRTNAYERSRNFIHFYFKNIGFNTVDNSLRFLLNLMVFNGYWLYKFYVARNFHWLTGLKGTVDGIITGIHEWILNHPKQSFCM